jgi:glycosyltransferase involved in cell wall biosynthesis
MISVITPTYRTPSLVLARTWASLKAQTHTDWEWVVWDDSPGDEVWRHLWGFAADERYALRAHRSMVPTGGNIGRIKRQAFMVAEGDIFVELDHDDELEPDALTQIAKAFEDPEVGFVWSDWCEINSEGQSCRYPEGWAWGYGADRWEREVWALSVPVANDVTMSHIVSAPNHVRAWRASTYRTLGGHNPDFPVCDDYELLCRTYDSGVKMVHIPHMLYRQHIGEHTAQRVHNGEIQRLVQVVNSRRLQKK